MSEQEDRTRYLLRRYAANLTTEAEVNELLDRLREPEAAEILKSFVDKLAGQSVLENTVDWDKVWSEVRPKEGSVKAVWWKAAAAVLIIAGGYLVYYNVGKDPGNSPETIAMVNDVEAPVGNKAVLTLGDGSTIVLDSAASGTLAEQGNVRVLKLANGQLTYSLEGPPQSKVMMNSMSTPKGGQYEMVLPDGTKVWLNAASSITYPVAFTGEMRSVSIDGEVYFEVAPDKNRPFIVDKGNMQIRVLGTHFNVKAYEDENNMRVTLLEGSVKVSNGAAGELLLNPGQQAVATDNMQLKIDHTVDIEQVMAWRNGYFSFKNSGLKTVMGQLARWYNVEVVYEGAIPDMQFGGEIARNTNLSQVLAILQESKVRFRIVKNTGPGESLGRIIVSP